jgi:type VI secretion system secreted protein Hcp
MAAYIKVEGIKAGESLAKGHEGKNGWMEIGSFQFGSGRSISTPTGMASKREASLPRVSDVTITKLQDSTSPLLFQESVSGKPGKVQIDITQTGTNDPVVFCTLTLTDALIASYSVSGGGDRPTESVVINFTKIEYHYQGYDKTGTPVAALKQVTGFDLAKVQH